MGKNITIEIYNHSFTLVGVVDDIQELTWVRGFQEVGRFELFCGIENSDFLIAGYFVMRSDRNDVFYITTVEKSRDIDGNAVVHVMGVDALNILNQRIILYTINHKNKTLKNLVEKILVQNITEPITSSNMLPATGNLASSSWTKNSEVSASGSSAYLSTSMTVNGEMSASFGKIIQLIGQKFTLSFYAWDLEGTGVLDVYLMASSTTVLLKEWNTTGDNIQYSVSFTVDESRFGSMANDTPVYIVFRNETGYIWNASIQVSNIMLNVGDTKKTWTPSQGTAIIDNVRSLGDYFSIGTITASQALTKQISYDYVLSALYDLAMQFNCGLTSTFSNNKIAINFVPFNNRSQWSTQNSLYFSDSIGNLSAWNFSQDYSEFKNYALIAGEGEGASRKKTSVGVGYGINLYEMFVDARDLSTDSDDGTLSNTEYTAMLEERGYNELAEADITYTLTAEASKTIYTYPSDYDVGDVASIETPAFLADGLIAKVTEVFDQTGYSVFPTFRIIALHENLMTESDDFIITEDSNLILT